MIAQIIHASNGPIPVEDLELWASIWNADVRANDVARLEGPSFEARRQFRRDRMRSSGQLWERLAERGEQRAADADVRLRIARAKLEALNTAYPKPRSRDGWADFYQLQRKLTGEIQVLEWVTR